MPSHVALSRAALLGAALLGAALLFAPAALRAHADAPPNAPAEVAPAPAEIPDAAPLPVAVAANAPQLRYAGRFDTRDNKGPRCAWPASSVAIRFRGTNVNVRLAGGHDTRWQIEVDGQPTRKLALRDGEHSYRLTENLPDGEHTVRLVQATEAIFGSTQVRGFELNRGARLLNVPAPKFRLEIVGDSISAGYGNEASSKEEHFSPDTQNAYFTYGAIAARELGGEVTDLAWSGKKMWPDNRMPELYDVSLPPDKDSAWNFKTQADAVLINLATNDFAGGNPEKIGWTSGYKAFLRRVRAHYPNAQILCAIGPMMGDWGPGDKPLTTLRAYLSEIVRDLNAEGDAKVKIMDFGTQDAANGFGADWHPNVKTHRLMADQLREVLRQDLKLAP